MAQRVDRGGALAPAIDTGEQVVAATNGDTAHRPPAGVSDLRDNFLSAVRSAVLTLAARPLKTQRVSVTPLTIHIQVWAGRADHGSSRCSTKSSPVVSTAPSNRSRSLPTFSSMTPADPAEACAMTFAATVTGSSTQTLLPESCWLSPNSLRQAFV